MAVLVSDLVSQVNNRLLAGIREQRNKLSAAVTDLTTGSLAFTYELGGIKAGAAVYVDLEGFYVWDTDDAGKTAVVERGQFGSTAATHAINTVAFVNPRFPKADIVRALNDELVDLSSPANGLFRMRTVELTFNVATVGYDLTGVSNVEDVYQVQAKYPWLQGNWKPVDKVDIQRVSNLTDFPSGFALFLSGGGFPGNTLRVLYKDKFSPVVNLTDDVNSVSGLTSDANDILVLGAQLRLMAPREAKRSFMEAQGDPRRAEEVPAGASRASIQAVAALREQRIRDEAARMSRQYPMRRRG